MDLPLGLVTALESGNCVLFLGSGLGHNMTRPDGSALPDGANLARHLAEQFRIPVGPEGPDLAQVSQLIQTRHTRTKLVKAIDEALGDATPDADFEWLMSLTWKAVFTTNYDSAIEECYERQSNPTQTPAVISANSETKPWDPRFEVPIFHLHGSLASEAGKESILITEDDYAVFKQSRQMLFDQFRLTYATTPVLYIGYSNRDPNWKTIQNELRSQLDPTSPPPCYRIAPNTDPLEIELLRSRGIESLDGDLDAFRGIVESTLGSLRVEPHNLTALERNIPTELLDPFRSNPAAVARLLNSWVYVNQADFSAAPNMDEFFKGDKPNWGLVGQGLNFQRDLEQEMFDDLLDWATDPEARPKTDIVLSPAGYGTSTLLMAVAAWFVRNKIGTTLFLRSGATFRAADLEYAARELPGPLVVVVDNALDVVDQIRVALDALRSSGVRFRFLMGERLNEWRQRRSPIAAHEYSIDPLSDDEIIRLLESLERQGALGRLEDLPSDLRVAAVREKNQKELLVTMRELTEGRAFDAIIEDEYLGIESPDAQRLYGLVCAFSRIRALARDQLCSESLGMSTMELYDTLRNSLEGLCIWHTVDSARGIEALRARHQVIADIVWDRCLSPSEREDLLLAGLGALNLTFGIDAKAFESLTRDDAGVDSLSSFEARTRFFEDACRKDPSNPYVRQHYSRMLRREKRYELALSQIDAAIAIAPRAKILSHTRGIVLREIALDPRTTVDVARRRLAQAESAFKSSVSANKKDEYSYQSLIELYLEWASRSQDEAESVLYISKAQEIINEGLQNVRNREGIYLVAARVEDYLGNTPGRIEALRKALLASPSSAVVRYLMGKVLLRTGNVGEALTVLHDGVRIHPDDPNLCMTYARALHRDGRSYSECLAVLSLASIRGERDPAYVAVLGGMYAMNGQLDESREVFNRANDRNFTNGDRGRIAFKPENDAHPVTMTGAVATVGAGFAFLRAKGLPDFYCRSSLYEGVRVVVGQRCEFTPGFAARGPAAVSFSLL